MVRGTDWKWWAAVVGAAAGLRTVVALLLFGRMPMVSDARDYFDVAARFASADFHGAFYWPPGESLVLACAFATFGTKVLVARIVTIAMSVATVALCALLARELAGEREARAAAWTGVLYAPAVLLCGQTYTQHLTALCVAAVAYFGLLALRERSAWLFVVTGAALGVGCLTRPATASVVPVLMVAWVIAVRRVGAERERLALGAVIATCAALVFVLPALAHNAGSNAGYTLSTNNERNLLLGNNPYTPDYKSSHLGQRALEDLPPEVREYLESFYRQPDARAAMRGAALSYMAHHPLRTAWRTLLRATSFWGFDYLGSREIQKWGGWSARGILPLLALEAGSYLAVTALALTGLLSLGQSCDSACRAWLVALVLGYEMPYAIAFSGGTYHFPIIPLVVPFAAVAIVKGAEAWRRTGSDRRAVVVVALGAFALLQAGYAYIAVTMS